MLKLVFLLYFYIFQSGGEIEKSKMMLHEVYCMKNLYKCKECGKPVEKKQKEAHDLEFHTPVPCPHCNLPQEKTKLEEHIKNCPKKPKLCEFCELEMPTDKYTDHIIVCGSKTNLCPKCGKYIQRKDWSLHQKFPCEPEKPIPPKDPPKLIAHKPEVPLSKKPEASKKPITQLPKKEIKKSLPNKSGISGGVLDIKPKKPEHYYPNSIPKFEEIKKKSDKQNKPKNKREEEKERQMKLDEELAAALMYDDPSLSPSKVPIQDPLENLPPPPEYKTEQLIPDRPHHHYMEKNTKRPTPPKKHIKEYF